MEHSVQNDQKPSIVYLAVALLISSIALFRTMMALHDGNLALLSEMSYAVTQGKPYWIAFQNRLMGPYLILWGSKLGYSYLVAFQFFVFATIAIQQAVLYAVLRNMALSLKQISMYMAMFWLLFLTFQHYWYYPWDSIDTIVFTILAWGVLKSKGTGFFVFLFAIALLNRESALFIALYLVIDAFEFSAGAVSYAKAFSIRLVDKTRLCVGAALTVLGLLYVKLVREYLFVVSANGTDDVKYRALGNHVRLTDNLEDLYFNIFSRDVSTTVLLIGIVIYLAYGFKAMSMASRKLVILLQLMVLNILIFGFVNETRIYLILLPLFLLLYVGMHEGATADRKPSEVGIQGD